MRKPDSVSSLLEVSEILISQNGVAHLQAYSPCAGLSTAAMAVNCVRRHRVGVSSEMIVVDKDLQSEIPEVRKERPPNDSAPRLWHFLKRRRIKQWRCIPSKYITQEIK